jgi:hypothetical protein
LSFRRYRVRFVFPIRQHLSVHFRFSASFFVLRN